MKKIKRVNIQFHARTTMRDNIRQLNKILERFATDEGMEEYIENGIGVTAGFDGANIACDPYTWDMVEEFVYRAVCHLIEEYELDEFPYYAEMRDRYAAALGEQPHSFTY